MGKVRLILGLLVPVVALILAGTMVVAPVEAALPNFGAARIELSTPGAKSVFPVIAYDSNGKAHVAWMQFDGDEAALMYRNNISGGFNRPHEVTDSAGATREPNLAIAVAGDGVHLFYTAADGNLREAILGVDGAGTVVGQSNGTVADGQNYTPNAITDSAGRVHVAWTSGSKQIRHRVDGVTRTVRPNGSFQNFASLAATDNGQVHITYLNGSSIGYSFSNGGDWQPADAPSAPGKLNIPVVTSDGSNLYLAFSVTEGRHKVYLSTRSPSGGWSSLTLLSDPNSGFADFPHIFASRSNKTVYATWEADGNIQVREIVPGVGPGARTGVGRGTEPFGAAGPGNAGVVWQDKATTGTFRIMFAGGPVSAFCGNQNAPAPNPVTIPGPFKVYLPLVAKC